MAQKKQKTEEEVYTLTLKGLIHVATCDLNIDNDLREDITRKVYDTIELYLRRHYSKGGHPGIVLNLDTGKFEFTTLNYGE